MIMMILTMIIIIMMIILITMNMIILIMIITIIIRITAHVEQPSRAPLETACRAACVPRPCDISTCAIPNETQRINYLCHSHLVLDCLYRRALTPRCGARSGTQTRPADDAC